jgi:hypothetical protein
VGAAELNQDGGQHAKPVAEGVKVADPVDPGIFETGNLGNAESFLRDAHVDQRLDLEAVAPQHPVALA